MEKRDTTRGLVREIIGHFTNIRLMAELVSAAVTALLSFDFYSELRRGRTLIQAIETINLQNVIFAMFFSLVLILFFMIFFSLVIGLVEFVIKKLKLAND